MRLVATLKFVGSALLAAGWLSGTAALAQPIPAKPIPEGYGFPTPKAVIDQWVATSDTAKIREHAWNLWAGMSADSGETLNGKSLPIWETWYGTEELFNVPNTELSANRTPSRAFISPNQFNHLGKLQEIAPSPNAQVVSFNKFDPAAAAFILRRHPGPGGKTYAYNDKGGLNALNAAWPAGTTGEDRGIEDFPQRAIETKPVMGLVLATGLTPQPLWQGLAGATNRTNPTPNTWTTCVLIDPQGSGELRPATPQEIAQANPATGLACDSEKYLYGPLSLFYSFAMSAAEATAFNSAQGSTQAQAGDYAVLQAMHVNTKEITFWTWQTYYWQPGADTPGGFPGSKAGQTSNLRAPWTNYATCTAYAQTTEPGGTTMTVCFNPYLETSPGIPAGITSNCMSCHGVAQVGGSTGYPPNYDQPIDFFHDQTYFPNCQPGEAGCKPATHTDFSWAVVVDSQ